MTEQSVACNQAKNDYTKALELDTQIKAAEADLVEINSEIEALNSQMGLEQETYLKNLTSLKEGREQHLQDLRERKGVLLQAALNNAIQTGNRLLQARNDLQATKQELARIVLAERVAEDRGRPARTNLGGISPMPPVHLDGIGETKREPLPPEFKECFPEEVAADGLTTGRPLSAERSRRP